LEDDHREQSSGRQPIELLSLALMLIPLKCDGVRRMVLLVLSPTGLRKSAEPTARQSDERQAFRRSRFVKAGPFTIMEIASIGDALDVLEEWPVELQDAAYETTAQVCCSAHDGQHPLSSARAIPKADFDLCPSYRTFFDNAAQRGNNFLPKRRRIMRELPGDIDVELVIEIARRVDDGDPGPIPIRKVVRRIRQTTPTRLSDRAIEELVVEMASRRGLTVIFDNLAAEIERDRK
jgi:hypothetical protein